MGADALGEDALPSGISSLPTGRLIDHLQTTGRSPSIGVAGRAARMDRRADDRSAEESIDRRPLSARRRLRRPASGSVRPEPGPGAADRLLSARAKGSRRGPE